MIGWVAWALAGSPCEEEALGKLPVLELSEAWPESGRCLDRGLGETLLERARRCVREVPEDPASVRVLGALGGRKDVPVLEALGTNGWHVTDVVEALESIDTRGSREALLRLACRGSQWRPAVHALLQDPREDEIDLYLEVLEKGGSSELWALGSVGAERTRRALIHAGKLKGLVADPHPDAAAALQDLVGPTDKAVLALRSMVPNHPMYVPLLDRLWDEPRMQIYLPRRSWALRDEEALPRIEQLLREGEPRVQTGVASVLGEEPDRFPELTERVLRAGPPHARVRLAQFDRAYVPLLWELVDDPDVGWEAARTLLRRTTIPEEERRALAERVLAEAPEGDAARRVARELLEGTPSPRTRLLEEPSEEGRPRDDVADADALLDAWRSMGRRLSVEERRWVKAVGPWIWQDWDDLRRLRGYLSPSLLADAGDAVGMEILGEDPQFRYGMRTVRPWLNGPAARPAQRPDHAVTTLRALERGELAEGVNVYPIAEHPGQRWRLVAALDEVGDAEAERLLKALVAVDWRLQAVPAPVLEAARSMDDERSVRVLAVVGDVDALKQRLVGEGLEARRAWSALVDVVITSVEPHPASVDLVRAELAHRGLDAKQQVAAWRVPALRAALAPDPCSTVELAARASFDIADDALLAAIRTCGRTPRLPVERGARIQEALLASGDVPLALRAHPASPELLAELVEAPEHRAVVLRELSSTEPPDELWPTLEQWLATWGEPEREALRELDRVFGRYRRQAGLRILGERLIEGNDDVVIDVLIGRSGDDLEVLVPVVARGGPQGERVAERIRGVSKEVYARHRALIDAELAPSWEVRP